MGTLVPRQGYPSFAGAAGGLDGYCSGIAYRHRQEGLSDPTADFLLRRVRRGLRRILGVAPKEQKRAFDPPHGAAPPDSTSRTGTDRLALHLGLKVAWLAGVHPDERTVSTMGPGSTTNVVRHSPGAPRR